MVPVSTRGCDAMSGPFLPGETDLAILDALQDVADCVGEDGKLQMPGVQAVEVIHGGTRRLGDLLEQSDETIKL